MTTNKEGVSQEELLPAAEFLRQRILEDNERLKAEGKIHDYHLAPVEELLNDGFFRLHVQAMRDFAALPSSSPSPVEEESPKELPKQ